MTKEIIQRSVYLEKVEEINWLKSEGYSIAEFYRQAITAHKAGKWKYDRMNTSKDNDDEE